MPKKLAPVEPLITQRQREGGGWLAISPPGSRLRIGVCADTEPGARAAFASALDAWDKLLNEPGSHPDEGYVS